MTEPELVALITRYRTEKPEGWKREVRSLLYQLEQLRDPYREHVYTGVNKGMRAGRWTGSGSEMRGTNEP